METTTNSNFLGTGYCTSVSTISNEGAFSTV